MSHYKSASRSTPALTERKGGWTMRDNRGFTMVELIVVMAILGVLTGMAIPAFSRIKDKAREVRAMEEIRGMEKNIGAFAIDNGGALPEDIAVLMDPWGNKYVYHKITGPDDGVARLDGATNPLNTDYDLYSLGPDGHTSRSTEDDVSHDDVVRSGDGGYVGMAAY
jgi:general secretion pathway protein G